MAATDILGLADARRAVRVPAADTTRDAELLEDYVPAVTPIVEDVVGPVVIQSFTKTILGGVDTLVLPHVNVAVTSVTVAGASVTGYTVDTGSGIVWPAAGTFGTSTQSVVVTYTAGMVASTAAVPPPIRLAARMILAWLWQRDQNGTRPASVAPDGSTVKTQSGFDVPMAAYSLLSGYAQGAAPGFA